MCHLIWLGSVFETRNTEVVKYLEIFSLLNCMCHMLLNGTMMWFYSDSDFFSWFSHLSQRRWWCRIRCGTHFWSTPMIPVCHFAARLFFVFLILSQSYIYHLSSKCRIHDSWPMYDEFDDSILGKYLKCFSSYLLPFDKLQTFKSENHHKTKQFQPSFFSWLKNTGNSKGTCFDGANCNYSKHQKSRGNAWPWAKTSNCLVKNNAAILSFIKASDKVFVLLLLLEVFWEGSLWEVLSWDYRTF